MGGFLGELKAHGCSVVALVLCVAFALVALAGCTVSKTDDGHLTMDVDMDAAAENAAYLADYAKQAAEHVYAQFDNAIIDDGAGAPIEAETLELAFTGDGSDVRAAVEALGGVWASDDLMLDDGIEWHNATVHFDGAATREALQSLINAASQIPNVVSVHPNYIAETEGTSGLAYKKGNDWALDACGFRDIWSVVSCKDTVTVGVVDGFFWSEQADLEDNVELAWNVIQGRALTDDYLLSSGYTHGTNVAGIISAVNGNDLGVEGLSNNASMYMMECGLSNGGLSTAACHHAIRLLAGLPDPIDVINLSWGVNGLDPANETDAAFLAEEQEVLDYAIEHGVVLVAAAGNSGPLEEACYPARFDECIGVAAMYSPTELFTPSQTGAGVDIAAPGYNNLTTSFSVRSNARYSNYTAFSYTSCASPHVAAAAALIRAAHTDMPPAEVKALLCDNAIGETHVSGYNMGRGSTGDIGAGFLHLNYDMFTVEPEAGTYVVPETLFTKVDADTTDAQGNASLGSARFSVSCKGASAVFETAADGSLDFAHAQPVEGVWLCKHDGVNYLPEGAVKVRLLSTSPGYVTDLPVALAGYVIVDGVNEPYVVWRQDV